MTTGDNPFDNCRMFITTEDGKEHELSGDFDTQIDIPPAQEKIFVHERLKTVSVISPLPDGESAPLCISPKDFTIDFSWKRAQRWRNVQKAYKLMRMIEPKIYLGRGYWAVIDRKGKVKVEWRGVL